jgi:predicted ATPase/DNA-binding CsgD family transcriptional regulator
MSQAEFNPAHRQERYSPQHSSTTPHALTTANFSTPFIGREVEVSEILRLIRDPNCHLLTLVGPGGIGKTRLAAQVMAQLQNLGHSVTFVDLQPVQSGDLLPSAIVDALGLPHGSNDALEVLCHHLSSSESILVLDNFEHLLEGVGLLAYLLKLAPRLKLLVTSRVVLHLQEEWLYPVEGLHFPADPMAVGAEGELDAYDAIRLFVSCARRVRPDFHLAAESTGVARVCRQVEGMPLAIELATAWTHTLSADAIAEEIEGDLDFLATSLRNAPEKHRSMLVIFQRSWQLLSLEERTVLNRLSVFRGGFDLAAAIAVTETSLATLAALVDKSLLRRRSTDRYEMHELLRHYAAEQLAQSVDDRERTQDRHSQYYVDFLGSRVGDLTTQQRDALAQTQIELDNIRTAWQWAVEQQNVANLRRAAMPFFAFCQGQSRYQEGVDALIRAFDALQRAPASAEKSRTLADLLTGRGWLELRLGRAEEAGQALERACQIYAATQFAPEPVMGADPMAALPLVAVIRGDYHLAVDLANEAWQAASAHNDPANLTLAGYSLTSAAIARGSYKEAFDHARKTLSLARLVGNRWFTAYIHNHLGEITQALGDLAAARNYFQTSYEIRREFDDPEGMAVALNHLGDIALQEGAYEDAQELYQQSLRLYKGIGDRGGLMRSLHGLGVAAHQLGQHALAQRYLLAALQLAAESQITPILLSVLSSVGAFLLESSSRRWGIAALVCVEQHPACDLITQDQVRRLLAAHSMQGRLPLSDVTESLALDELITALETELSMPIQHTADTVSAFVRPLPARQQSLTDPLSEREQEVLSLVARGMKNSEIADELVVTLSTVKAHINNIYRRLDVTNRVQAISRGQELGLL